MNKYKELYEKSQLELLGYINERNSYFQNPLKIKSVNQKLWNETLKVRDCSMNTNRYVWKNLPMPITSNELENLFYLKGSLCFFEDNGKLVVATYAKQGKLNKYGKLDEIMPIDLSGKSYDKKYSVIQQDGSYIKSKNVAVIINDYTSYYDTPTPRAVLSEKTTIKEQVDVYCILHNAIITAIKKAIILCDNEEQKTQMERQLSYLINPDSFVNVVSKTKGNGKSILDDIQLFNMNGLTNYQDYMQIAEYFDKIRQNYCGLPTSSPFEKRERLITGEIKQANIDSAFILEDGFNNRLNGLNLIKKYINVDGVNNIEVIKNPILEENKYE